MVGAGWGGAGSCFSRAEGCVIIHVRGISDSGHTTPLQRRGTMI